MLYQTLVGAWPITADRALAFLEKAVREAKLHTSWDAPNQIYESAVNHFASAVLRSRRFMTEVAELAERLRRPGWSNSLAVKLLTMTAPGVPDLYQGTELWDLSLVDPDNRRPVDYEARAALLKDVVAADLGQLWAEGDGRGLIKLAVVHRALELRSRKPSSFGEGRRGAYEPLLLSGPAADHGVAFSRGGDVVTTVTRWPLALDAEGGWRNTSLALPPGNWADVLSGRRHEGDVLVKDVMAALPVALLEKVRGPSTRRG
jgi:(1->4)-alpha-D-glucan 1-alpha-D-glucosylmutase